MTSSLYGQFERERERAGRGSFNQNLPQKSPLILSKEQTQIKENIVKKNCKHRSIPSSLLQNSHILSLPALSLSLSLSLSLCNPHSLFFSFFFFFSISFFVLGILTTGENNHDTNTFRADQALVCVCFLFFCFFFSYAPSDWTAHLRRPRASNQDAVDRLIGSCVLKFISSPISRGR